MTEFLTLEELAGRVPSGCSLGIGGVHLSRLPLALIRKMIAGKKRDLRIVSWGGGFALELLLDAKAVRKLAFCFSSLDIFGLAPRFREALEKQEVEVEEWTALAMMQALHAAHFRLPEMPFQLPAGSDLMQNGEFWKSSSSVFSGEPIGQARRLDIDCLLLHVQRADRAGNIEIQGARGFDLSLLGAAQNVLVTAEERVEPGMLGTARGSFVLPREFVTAIAHVPWGAWPTACLPYYSTDYRELLCAVREEQQRRRNAGTPIAATTEEEARPDSERRAFLAATAALRTADLTQPLLTKHRIPTESASWTIDELMAVCLSREYDNRSLCSVGSVSPLAMVSYLLAKRTHAPQLTIIALNGGFIDIDVHPMSLSAAEPLEFGSAKVFWGGDETYHWYYQQGRITHEVITTAQLDRRGRTNNAWIESGEKRIRLPGQGGMADVANLHRNFTLYLARHTRERFVEAVDFCTAARGLLTDEERRRAGLPPGKVRVITELGIFELNHADRIFHLTSLHPQIALEEVRDRTGGELLVSEALATTEPPSPEELRLIREEIDPFGIRRLEFIASRDRLTLIESILDAEAGLIGEIVAGGRRS
ncbi:MAG TPA: CoA-transferase [Acidobacteriaceae bacterium]|jgi:glutaconate CoA-transferase subunit A|nr:CoA-transferase [Acidobacteriaceae bacterium]